MSRVEAKLHTMRKPQSFHVSPTSDGRVMVQSDKSIGMFDFRTGKGVLNTKGCYFPHLNKVLGAFPYTFPPEFVSACLEACPALDSITVYGSGGTTVLTVVNTVQITGKDVQA